MADVRESSNSHDDIAEYIRSELEKIITVPLLGEIVTVPMVFVSCLPMLRVPDHIKQSNPAAYEPRLISIGPVFHGRDELQPMEAFKKRYAQEWIKRFDVDIQTLTRITKEREERLRKDYDIDSSKICSREFVKIMAIDGAFLVELLCRQYDGMSHELDIMTNQEWKILMCDLLLLDNQIPYYYLGVLITRFAKRENNELLDDFLEETVLPHFVQGCRHQTRYIQANHLLDSLRAKMDYMEAIRDRTSSQPSASCPTISQLRKAGVKVHRPSVVVRLRDAGIFICGGRNPKWFLGARIAFRGGILEIPQFVMDENTERYFSNLLASELMLEKDRYATDYIAFMDYLIDSPEDVQILVEKGILQNLLEDDKAAAIVINRIGRSTDVRPDFLYRDIVEDLNSHCKNRWNKLKFEWKRELMSNYLGNPWTTLSVIAAILLLGLTIIQAVCSVLQVKEANGKKGGP